MDLHFNIYAHLANSAHSSCKLATSFNRDALLTVLIGESHYWLDFVVLLSMFEDWERSCDGAYLNELPSQLQG